MTVGWRHKIKAICWMKEKKFKSVGLFVLCFDESSSVWRRIPKMLHRLVLSVDQGWITTSLESGDNAIQLFTV